MNYGWVSENEIRHTSSGVALTASGSFSYVACEMYVCQCFHSEPVLMDERTRSLISWRMICWRYLRGVYE